MRRMHESSAAARRRERAWAAGNPGNQALREEAIRALSAVCAPELSGGGLLLDAGCGTGWWLERMARDGVSPSRLCGIDRNADRVETSRSRVGSEADLREGDVRALPWPDETFAAVFLLLVLSSLPDADAV